MIGWFLVGFTVGTVLMLMLMLIWVTAYTMGRAGEAEDAATRSDDI